MPEIHVTDEQGTEHVFPDGSTPEMIAKVLNVKAPEALQPGMLDPRGGWAPGDVLRGAVSGVKNMVAHPIDTLAGMAQPFMASGVAPGGMYPTTAATGRPEDSQANAQMQQSAQQGQADAAKSIKKNPAYAIGGVVGPAVVTAGVTKFAPMVGDAALEGAGRASLLGKTPEAAYESALKPSTTLSQAQRTNIVNAGLENAIPISKGGLEKLGARIDTLNQAIADQIATDPNRPIRPSFQPLKSVRDRFQNQVTPAADIKAINSVGDEFADRLGPNGQYPQGSIPADAAQAMKQGTYRTLKGKFGEQGSATVEAQKALARDLKDEIASQFPEIGNLNAQESKLLDLEPVLERAVNRTANHQLIGIGSPIAGTAIKATTGSTTAGAVAMALKSVLDNPMVKSRLAIAVSKGQKIPFSQASAKVQAYSAALAATAGATQATRDDQTANQTP